MITGLWYRVDTLSRVAWGETIVSNTAALSLEYVLVLGKQYTISQLLTFPNIGSALVFARPRWIEFSYPTI